MCVVPAVGLWSLTATYTALPPGGGGLQQVWGPTVAFFFLGSRISGKLCGNLDVIQTARMRRGPRAVCGGSQLGLSGLSEILECSARYVYSQNHSF